MTEIKPCAHCGGEVHLIPKAVIKRIRFYVQCEHCDLRTPPLKNEAEAITAWNQRVPDPALLNGLREAREALAPFAATAEHDIGDSETDNDAFRPMSWKNARAEVPTVGHFRRALKALAHLDTLLAQEGES